MMNNLFTKIKCVNRDEFVYYIRGIKYHIEFTTLPLYNKDAVVKSIIIYGIHTIKIDSKISIENQKHCLIHELCHSVIYETQLCPMVNYTEEHLCELMAMYGEHIVDAANKIIHKRYIDNDNKNKR